jgi:hypothetical protein
MITNRKMIIPSSSYNGSPLCYTAKEQWKAAAVLGFSSPDFIPSFCDPPR